MDPPTSHVLTNNIDTIDIIEGPYDVENFGTLSGAVKIKTKQPEENLHGEVNFNAGSWGYQKIGATISGGNQTLRGLLSISSESSSQYEDGNGDDFEQQIKRISTPATTYTEISDAYSGIDAYSKQTTMAKLFYNPNENQALTLSYTANRSDDILYPSSKMDALYDDSNILNVSYSISNISPLSKKLTLEYFDSDVDHPMSTKYRNASGAGSVNEVISSLTTQTQGFKLKNLIDINDTTLLNIGIDNNQRNWNGSYIGYGTKAMATGRISIDDVNTDNVALFAELEKKYSQFTLTTGARLDDTSTTSLDKVVDNKYSTLSAFVRASYPVNQSTKLIAGIGRSSRVPDARELYFKSMTNVTIGTPTLTETTNQEIDLSIENNFDDFSITTKLFHSSLTDYIYFNSSKASNNFENIDATIYGLSVSGFYTVNDKVYTDFGLAYQVGKKDSPLAGQTDTDLANITPLKVNLGVNYDYSDKGTIKFEVVATDTWDNFDSDNGEQLINGYEVLNIKAIHHINRNLEITLGVDNVFDETYAVNNTYKDLTLLADGSGDVMLLNEPGRYFYVNASYKF